MKSQNPLGVVTPAEIKQRTDVMERIFTHYDHAREKHPYFCDKLLPIPDEDLEGLQDALSAMRRELREDIERGKCAAFSVAVCELLEFEEAAMSHDTAHAVDECYDAIAVLMRAIDVLEGRQKLGKPETKGNSK